MWKAGWARRASGVLATTVLGMALWASGGALAAPATGALAGHFAGDARMIGVPPALFGQLALDPPESVAAAKLIEGYPGAAGVAVAAYRALGAAADYEGFDSGRAWWSKEGCRIVMPTAERSIAGLASFAKVSPAEAKRMGLDQLEALHELGHCWQRLDSVGFDLPGLSPADAKALGDRVFSPTMQALADGGAAARLWGESFADAFMAIEKLSASGGADDAVAALRVLAKARQARSTDEAEGDSRHPGSAPIDAALAEAGKWTSMAIPERLKAAQRIASQSTMDALGEEPADFEEIARLASDGHIGRLVIEDAGLAWAEAGGKPSRYATMDLGLEGFERERQAQGERLVALMAAAREATRLSSSAIKGFSWTAMTPKAERLRGRALSAAMDSPAFQAALGEFGKASPDSALAHALARADAAAKQAALAREAPPEPPPSLLVGLRQMAAKRAGHGPATADHGPKAPGPKDASMAARKSM